MQTRTVADGAREANGAGPCFLLVARGQMSLQCRLTQYANDTFSLVCQFLVQFCFRLKTRKRNLRKIVSRQNVLPYLKWLGWNKTSSTWYYPPTKYEIGGWKGGSRARDVNEGRIRASRWHLKAATDKNHAKECFTRYIKLLKTSHTALVTIPLQSIFLLVHFVESWKTFYQFSKMYKPRNMHLTKFILILKSKRDT